MNIICIGANLESEIVLRGFAKHGIKVAALVTLPPGQAPGISDYVDLHDLAQQNGILVIDTVDINSRETLQAIKDVQPDHLFTLGWNRLYREELLNLPIGLAVGSHPTPLPEGRGRAPIPWTILLDKRTSASTLFQMALGADDGSILEQEPFQIPEGSNALEVYTASADAMLRAYLRLHMRLESEEAVVGVPQDDAEATHYARRIDADGELDFTQPAADLERLTRAVSFPYPGAFSFYRGEKVRIWRVQICSATTYHGLPGQIVASSQDGVTVMTGSGALLLQEAATENATVDLQSLPIGSRFVNSTQHELSQLRG